MQVIRPVANDRVDEGIEDQSQGQGDADEAQAHPDDLAVEKQQEIGQSAVLDPVGDGSDALVEAGDQGRLARDCAHDGRLGRGRFSGHVSSPAPSSRQRLKCSRLLTAW